MSTDPADSTAEKDAQAPNLSHLFLGPSGVGKTAIVEKLLEMMVHEASHLTGTPGTAKAALPVIITTGNAPDIADLPIIDEPLKNSRLFNDEAFRKRFEKIEIKPLSAEALEQIAGIILARELKDEKPSGDERKALGEIAMIMARQHGYDEEKGARGLSESLRKALQDPIPVDIELQICHHSPAYRKRVHHRRGELLATAFRTGIAAPVKALKTFRINPSPGVKP